MQVFLHCFLLYLSDNVTILPTTSLVLLVVGGCDLNDKKGLFDFYGEVKSIK